MQKSKLPIIKAFIPLEVIRYNKIIPKYDYIRPLEDNEKFIIREQFCQYKKQRKRIEFN